MFLLTYYLCKSHLYNKVVLPVWNLLDTGMRCKEIPVTGFTPYGLLLKIW